jgi:hypothetical protein
MNILCIPRLGRINTHRFYKLAIATLGLRYFFQKVMESIPFKGPNEVIQYLPILLQLPPKEVTYSRKEWN